VLLLATGLSSSALAMNENALLESTYSDSYYQSNEQSQQRHMQLLNQAGAQPDPAGSACDHYYYVTRVTFGSTMGLQCTDDDLNLIGTEINTSYDEVLALDQALSTINLETMLCLDNSTNTYGDDDGIDDDGYTRALKQEENKDKEEEESRERDLVLASTPLPTIKPTTRPTRIPAKKRTKRPTQSPIQYLSPPNPASSPTRRPTLRPTLSPKQKYFATTKFNYNWVGGGTCLLCSADNLDRKRQLLRTSYAVVDFSTDSRDRLLPSGEYVRFQWRAKYGMKIRAIPNHGGFAPNSKARLFNSSQPTGNDFELGSPNAFCDDDGPGWGEGGVPGKLGANCIPQGNVLIIQENNTDLTIPDDNAQGGRLIFSFDSPTRIGHLGLMSMSTVNGTAWIEVLTHDGKNLRIDFEGLGENSVQVVHVDHVVKNVELVMRSGGAVTEIGLFTPTAAEEALSSMARSYIKSKSPFEEYIPYLEFDLSYYLTRHINDVFGRDEAFCLFGKWVNIDVHIEAVPVLSNTTCE
jgi:hypothetical protein